MAKANFERGEKRSRARDIMRKMHITKTSGEEKIVKAAEAIAKSIGVEYGRARSYIRYLLLPESARVAPARRKGATKKSKAKTSAPKKRARKATPKKQAEAASAA